MDTEQKAPEAKQNPFQKLPRRTQYLFAALGIVVLLAGAYFIGASSYYRVSPLDKLQEEAVTAEHEAGYQEMLRLLGLATSVTCEPYTRQSAYNDMFENELYIERADPAICEEFSALGKASLGHLIYLGGYVYGGEVGAGVVSLRGKQHLVTFALTETEETINGIEVLAVAELKDTKAIESLSILIPDQKNRVVKMAGTNTRGVSFERYLTVHEGRYELSVANPAYKHEDGSFSQRVTSYSSSRYGLVYPVVVSFLLPSLSSVGQGDGDRNLQLETETGVSPLYHQQVCGKEETYADLNIATRIERIDSSGYVDIYVQTGAYPVLNITTPRFGYVPEDWGKVLMRISPEAFREQVRVSRAHNAQATSKTLTIEGHTVKSTGPHRAIGECKDWLADMREYQYQAVSGNAVISFLFTEYLRGEVQEGPFLSEKEREAIVAEVLRTLSIRPR